MLMVNNLVGFGAGGESLIVSTPTTWNPSDKGTGVTLAGGNLQYSNNAAGTQAVVRSVYSVTAGKWYWEVTVTASPGASTMSTGVGNGSLALSQDLVNGVNGWSYYSGGDKANAAQSAYGNSYTNGDVISVALDMDAGKIWFAKNGTWQASGDPVAGTNAAFTNVTGTIFAANGANANWTSTANFGASAFSYTPPVGFKQGLGA